eukprot:m.25163 g.25163  ORF g.25163 m.25163 type:complete len:846 (+) comp28754_c0_seq1:209-2746(+)
MSSVTSEANMRKARELTTQQPAAPVKAPKSAQSKPTRKQPTADQVGLQALIMPEKERQDIDLKKKLKKVSDVTGKDEDQVYFALVDCNMDETQAIDQLVEGTPVESEWRTSGSGKKKKTKEQRHTDRELDDIVAPGYETKGGVDEKKGSGGTNKAASKGIREGYGGHVTVTEKEKDGEKGRSGRGSGNWSAQKGGRGNFLRDGNGRGKIGYKDRERDNPRYNNHGGRPGRGKFGFSGRGKGDLQTSGQVVAPPGSPPEGGGDWEEETKQDGLTVEAGKKENWAKEKAKPSKEWGLRSGWNGVVEDPRKWNSTSVNDNKVDWRLGGRVTTATMPPKNLMNGDELQRLESTAVDMTQHTAGQQISALPEDPAIISVHLSVSKQRQRRRRVIKRGPSQIPSVAVEMPECKFDPHLDEEFSGLSFDCGSHLSPEPVEVETTMASSAAELQSEPISESHLVQKSSSLPPEAIPLLSPMAQEIVEPEILSSAHQSDPASSLKSQSPLVQEELQAEPEPFIPQPPEVSSLPSAFVGSENAAAHVMSSAMQNPSALGMPDPLPMPMPGGGTEPPSSQLTLSSGTTSTTSISTFPTATTQSSPSARSAGGAGKHAPPGMYHPAVTNPHMLMPGTVPYMMGYQPMDYELLRMQNAMNSRGGDALSISSGAGSFDKGFNPRDVTSGNPGLSQQPMMNAMYYPPNAGLYMPHMFGMSPYMGFPPYPMQPTKGAPSAYHGGASFGQAGNQNFGIPSAYDEQEFTKGTFVPATKTGRNVNSVDSYKGQQSFVDGQKSGFSGNPGMSSGQALLSNPPFPSMNFSGHGGRGGGSAKSGGGKYGGGSGGGSGSVPYGNWHQG